MKTNNAYTYICYNTLSLAELVAAEDIYLDRSYIYIVVLKKAQSFS